MNNPIRQNHYVPIWYQKGFLVKPNSRLFLMNLSPPQFELRGGKQAVGRSTTPRSPIELFLVPRFIHHSIWPFDK